jgi:hypothetical protein
MNSNLFNKAIELIPQLEQRFCVDMSLESFVKKDLPNYFFIKNAEKTNKVTYNFETEFGTAQLTVDDVYASEYNQSYEWNDILEKYLDSYMPDDYRFALEFMKY